MKLNARTLALAAALSVIFWQAVPTLIFMILPTSVLRFFLVQLALPLGMFFIVVTNALVTFLSSFLIVFTAARLYNRWVK